MNKLKIWAIIWSITSSIVASLFCVALVFFIIFIVALLAFDVDITEKNVLVYALLLYILFFFILAVWFYKDDKESTTCPQCKTAFAYESKHIKTQTLSEQIVSRDVKDEKGKYRRKAFRIGREKRHHRATCKECGYTKEWTDENSYSREIK